MGLVQRGDDRGGSSPHVGVILVVQSSAQSDRAPCRLLCFVGVRLPDRSERGVAICLSGLCYEWDCECDWATYLRRLVDV